ncbi:ATP-binding cassette domain-containing protein, partial [Leclercia adecarboxylata]|nr:ATP-binding cassette domain-containing protein [Leclercia adecarboxylata]
MNPTPQQPEHAQPLVRFAGVTKRYGELTVLDGLDLQIEEGEKVAIIGPSGSGKSTLLRVLMTLEGIDEGVIEVDGEPLTHMPDASGQLVPANARHLRRVRSKVGMVFQKPVPFPMTIFENVAYGIRHHEKLSKSEMTDRVEQALRQGALWDEVKDKLNQSALGLSGGQQQRLC